MTETELRTMVREVLGDILKDRRAGKALAIPAPPGPVVEPVSIANNGDLAAFVQRLIAHLDDPAKGPAIRSGGHVFTLANGQGGPAAGQVQIPAAAPAAPCAAELSGTITEARIAKIAKLGETDRIVLAPGAVLTPLANDRARAVGLKIERKR